MTDSLWVKMPSYWIANGSLSRDFSSSKNISTDIAALKIFVYMCLFGNPVKRRKSLQEAHWAHKNLSNAEIITQAEVYLTYDQISEGCSLSRKLVSLGLSKLIDNNLIKKEGTTKKIRYIVQGSLDSGWAKLPKRDLIKVNLEVTAFLSIKNRYSYERDALKLFLYLLTIRKNGFAYVDVSRGKISVATGIDVYHIDESLGYLQGIGIIDKVSSKGYLLSATENSEIHKLHRYYVVGSSGLILKSRAHSELDVFVDISND